VQRPEAKIPALAVDGKAYGPALAAVLVDLEIEPAAIAVPPGVTPVLSVLQMFRDFRTALSRYHRLFYRGFLSFSRALPPLAERESAKQVLELI